MDETTTVPSPCTTMPWACRHNQRPSLCPVLPRSPDWSLTGTRFDLHVVPEGQQLSSGELEPHVHRTSPPSLHDPAWLPGPAPPTDVVSAVVFRDGPHDPGQPVGTTRRRQATSSTDLTSLWIGWISQPPDQLWGSPRLHGQACRRYSIWSCDPW